MLYATSGTIMLLIPVLFKHTFSTVQITQSRVMCGLLTGKDVAGEHRALFYCGIATSQ
jgi:hypothetical protein